MSPAKQGEQLTPHKRLEDKLKIYIVMGSTGEYSDHSTWTVRAFVNYRRAEKFALGCVQLARTYKTIYNSFPETTEALDEAQRACKDLDPRFSCDYTGTEYFVSQDGIELDEDPE